MLGGIPGGQYRIGEASELWDPPTDNMEEGGKQNGVSSTLIRHVHAKLAISVKYSERCPHVNRFVL